MSLPDRTAFDRPVRLDGPGSLLQAVPYLLGFHPESSLVIVGVRDGALVVTVRIDLADIGDPRLLDHTVSAIARGGARELIAAAYDDDLDLAGGDCADTGSALADVLGRAADAAGCVLVDVLLVASRRWRSAACTRPACCPPGGSPVPDGVSEFQTAATYAGVVALPDRRALAAVLDPEPDGERAALAPLMADAENARARARSGTRHDRALTLALLREAAAADLPGWPGIGGDRRARRRLALLAGALAQRAVRDPVWLAIEDGQIDGRALWRELLRRAPAPYDAAPAFLYGWCAWRAGNGALAGIAVERALRADPDYAPAKLLAEAVGQGLDPRALPRLCDDGRPHNLAC